MIRLSFVENALSRYSLEELLQEIVGAPITLEHQVLCLQQELTEATSFDMITIKRYLLAVQLFSTATTLHEVLPDEDSILRGDYCSSYAYLLLAHESVALVALLQEVAMLHKLKIARALGKPLCTEEEYLSHLEYGLAQALLSALGFTKILANMSKRTIGGCLTAASPPRKIPMPVTDETVPLRSDVYLQPELANVESIILHTVSSDSSELSSALHKLVTAGGKRLRPTLVLLAGKCKTCASDKLYNVAAAVELLHLATLIHDDIIDNEFTRRGEPTLHSIWSKQLAASAGDFVFAQSVLLLHECQHDKAQMIFAKMLLSLCRAELQQISTLFCLQQTPLDYLRCIRRKTALFMSVSCRLGAMVNDLPPSMIKAMSAYGYWLGMAFQLRDDLDDFAENLAQGSITLPAIYAYTESTLAQRNLWAAYAESRGQDKEILAEIINVVQKSSAFSRCEDLLKRCAKKALSAICAVPQGSSYQWLIKITQVVINGKK